MESKTLAPIVLFVYNRPAHTKKTVSALKSNHLAGESNLFIFSDGAKSKADQKRVEQVREYIKKIKGFKNIQIIERDKNLGLANSVIRGVSEIFKNHKKAIILEDDIFTSPAFLVFMNKMLEKYEAKEKVFSITGYNYPAELMKIPENYPYDVYFSPRAGSWSWATWKDRWMKADWKIEDYDEFKNSSDLQRQFNKGGEDMSQMLINQMEGRIDSWAIRWCYSLFRNDGLCIYPVDSYVNNIGLDDSGTHGGSSNKYWNSELSLKTKNFSLPTNIEKNKEVIMRFRNVFKKRLAKRIKRFVVGLKERLKKLLLN